MVGEVVKITVNHPDGSDEFVLGKIGVITHIERMGNETDYAIDTGHSAYLYGKEQFRLADSWEIKEELKKRILVGE